MIVQFNGGLQPSKSKGRKERKALFEQELIDDF